MPELKELAMVGAGTWLLYQLISHYQTRSKLRHIPTVGSDHFILSYIYAWRDVVRGDYSSLREGYDKYRNFAFKVPSLVTSSGWLILVNSPELIEELRKAPSDVMSFNGATVDVIQGRHLLGKHADTEEFQIAVVRTPLTRSFPNRFADITDEIQASCEVYLPGGSEWGAVKAYETIVHIVCRTTNRLFVGLPLCRDPEYRQIQEDWTMHVMIAANIMHLVPGVLKPLAGRLLGKARSSSKKVEKFLASTINERLEKFAEFGTADYEGKANDLIQWFIDLAPPESRNVEDITMKIMLTNFAAIHTTSVTLTNVLFDIAARREYVEPLREEMEEVIRAHGWTKEGMGKMRKLDSFMKESSRLSGVATASLTRKALKDYTFANGLTIPAGCTVGAPNVGVHTNEEFYEDAAVFNGFRFSEMRNKGTNEYDPLRHQMVSLDSSYLLFGHGRHACPGRFFAVNETKAILAHILLNYDLKLPNDATQPPAGQWIASARAPNTEVPILMKKRVFE